MSDKTVPKLSRSKRETETREKTARRKAWRPPSRLDAPEAPPGYKHRWIRAECSPRRREARRCYICRRITTGKNTRRNSAGAP